MKSSRRSCSAARDGGEASGLCGRLRQDPQALESLRDLLQKAGDTSGDVELLELAAQGWIKERRTGARRRHLPAADGHGSAEPGPTCGTISSLPPESSRRPPGTPGSANAARRGSPIMSWPPSSSKAPADIRDELEAQIQSAIADAELLDKHQNPQKAIATLEPCPGRCALRAAPQPVASWTLPPRAAFRGRRGVLRKAGSGVFPGRAPQEARIRATGGPIPAASSPGSRLAGLAPPIPTPPAPAGAGPLRLPARYPPPRRP